MLGARGPAALLWIVLAVTILAAMRSPASARVSEADVYVGQAILDYDAKRFDDALASLQRALEIDPDNVEALYYSGLVWLARNLPSAAIPFLERARTGAPESAEVAAQLGYAYFSLGSAAPTDAERTAQYRRAQPLLESAFRADPTLDGLGYYVGFLRYRAKDYQGAIRAFDAGRASNPEVRQLDAIYRGLAQGILGLTGQAAATLEEARRLAPASGLTEPAERFRDALVQQRQQGRRLGLAARLGVFYDDNVAVVPLADPGDPLVALLRDQPPASFGELGGVRVDYAWLRTLDWEASIGGEAFATYNNDLPDFNIVDLLGSASLTRTLSLGAMPAQAGLQYVFDALFLGGPVLLQRNTVTAFGTLVESDLNLTQAYLRYQNVQFNKDRPEFLPEEQSGSNWAAGLIHLLRFAGDRHLIKVGYQLDYEDANGVNFRYLGNQVLLGGQYTLPWGPWGGVRLKYDLDVDLRNYFDSAIAVAGQGLTRRHDSQFTNLVRAEVPLPQRLTMSFEYQSIVNVSNIPVFHFTRNVYLLGLSWSY